MFHMGTNDRAAGEQTGALAAAIREAQGRVNMSGAELSRKSGVPYSTLRKIREGNQPIDFEELNKIAKALDVKASALAFRAESILKGE